MFINLGINFGGGSGGGADANAVHRYSASTIAEMNALTGVSEGDVCSIYVSSTVWNEAPESFYTYLRPSSVESLADAFAAYVASGVTTMKFTLVQNPYCTNPQPAGASIEFADYSGLWFDSDSNPVYRAVDYEGTEMDLLYNDNSVILDISQEIVAINGDTKRIIAYNKNRDSEYACQMYLPDTVVSLDKTYMFINGHWEDPLKLEQEEVIARALNDLQLNKADNNS